MTLGDNEHPADRSCWSAYRAVPMSRHEPIKMSDGNWWSAFLNVYLRRRPEDTDPLLFIDSEETDAELRLTIGEARYLRDVLDHLLEVAGL